MEWLKTKLHALMVYKIVMPRAKMGWSRWGEWRKAQQVILPKENVIQSWLSGKMSKVAVLQLQMVLIEYEPQLKD